LLLLYDVTSYSSFDNVSSWLNQIKELTDNQVLIMLIGNKIDKSQRVVSRETGERLARDNQINFLETSAKTGQNVELAFMTTAQDLLDKKLKKNNIHLAINHTVNETNNSCC
jgi:small GTP-binding protein